MDRERSREVEKWENQVRTLNKTFWPRRRWLQSFRESKRECILRKRYIILSLVSVALFSLWRFSGTWLWGGALSGIWEGKASWLGTSCVSSRSNGSCSKCFWQRITVSPVAHSAQSLENGSHLRPHVTALTGIPRSGHSVPERVADFSIARWTGQAGLVCRGFFEA